MSTRALITALGVLVMLAGCVEMRALQSEAHLAPIDGPVTVLLLEPEIELSELTAAGLTEPRADWTEAGRANVETAIASIMREHDAALVAYAEPENESVRHADHQLFKLHRAVGVTILRYRYSDSISLPTKQDRFDWTLGPDVMRLKERYDRPTMRCSCSSTTATRTKAASR